MFGEKTQRSRVRIYQRFAGSARKLESDLMECASSYSQGEREHSVAYCRGLFIELNDRWSLFSRRLLIASALGGEGYDGSINGVPGCEDESDVLHTLGVRVAWKNDRPWHVPSEFLGAARTLKVKNLATLNGSIGATPNSAEQVRVVRNLFAHRNPDTYMRARGHCRSARPEVFLLTEKEAGQFILVNWIAQLLAIARSAAS